MLFLPFVTKRDAIEFCVLEMDRLRVLVTALGINCPTDCTAEEVKRLLRVANSRGDASSAEAWLRSLENSFGSLPSRDLVRSSLLIQLTAVVGGILAALELSDTLPEA